MDDDEVVGVPLTTKLYPPRSRGVTVRRERLLRRLREGLQTPLTVVTGPAGWGKSLLVADWIQRDRLAAGRVSLDAGDSDPMLFWRYALLALRSAVDGAGELSVERRRVLADSAATVAVEPG